MKKLLLLIVVLGRGSGITSLSRITMYCLLAMAPTPALAQADVVKVQIGEGETCPVGWTTTDRAWTKPAKIYYVLPAGPLVAAHRKTTLGDRRGTIEFQVTSAFVTRVWPTEILQQAAYASGRLRSEPATSGSVRRCTLGQ